MLCNCSPGFLNEDYMQYMMERAVKEEHVQLLKNKSKFLKAHTSCGHKRAIEEMLTCPDLVGALGDVKAAEEVCVYCLSMNTTPVSPLSPSRHP